MPENQFETLYTEARQALKTKDYNRAEALLKQILVIDEDYKDASRLLAQLVKEKRRRWYNDIRVWGTVFGIVIIGLLVWIAPKLPWPKLSVLPTLMASPTSTTLSTQIAAPTLAPTNTIAPVTTPAPTLIPLAWKRISTGEFLPRSLVSAIVFDPQDPGIVYVSTANAGIYKSIDEGNSWQPIQKGLSDAYIASLTIDPQNPATLYAGALLGGVYKTTDSGQSWFPINSGIDVPDAWEGVSQVTLDPQNPQHLFYTNYNASYRSVDGGKSWAKLPQGEALGVEYLLVNSVTSAELLRVEITDQGRTISKSVNGGETWKPTGLALDLANSPRWGWRLAGNPLRSGEVVVYNSNVYNRQLFSDDFGNYWEAWLSLPIGRWRAEYPNCVAVAFDPVDRTRLYCAYDSYFGNNISWLQVSTDAGKSWQRVGQLDIFTWALAISPLDNKHLLAGEEGLRASINGGRSWKPVNSGLGAYRTNFLVDFNSSGFLSLIGFSADIHYPFNYDSQLFISRNQGNSWEPWQLGSTFSTGVGGVFWTEKGTDKGYTSTGPGNPSTVIRLPQTDLFLYPDAFVPKHLFAASDCQDQSLLYLSQDGGSTWKASTLSKSSAICKAQFNFVESDPELIYLSNEYYYSGSPIDGSLSYTTDDWGPRKKNYSGNSIDSGLYRSEDGGLSWVTCGSTTSHWYSKGRSGRLAVDPGSPQHIFLATRGAGVFVSVDGCRNWQASNTGLENLYLNSVVIDPNQPETVYAGTDSGAYLSTDGGQTWNQINDGLLGTTVIYSLLVNKDSTVYASTPDGVFKLEGK